MTVGLQGKCHPSPTPAFGRSRTHFSPRSALSEVERAAKNAKHNHQ